MIRILAEVLLALACLYLLYKAEPDRRMGNALYVLLAVSFMANAVSCLAGKAPAHTLLFEHYAISLGIALKFASVLATEIKPKGVAHDRRRIQSGISAQKH
jgi:hypothetical protein